MQSNVVGKVNKEQSLVYVCILVAQFASKCRCVVIVVFCVLYVCNLQYIWPD